LQVSFNNLGRRGSRMEKKVKISVDCEELDIAIKKIEQLAELLKEVQQVVDSIFRYEKSET